MNDDATEAVMGLLNLSGNLLPSPMSIEATNQPPTPTVSTNQTSKRSKYPGSAQGQQHHNRTLTGLPGSEIYQETHEKPAHKADKRTLTSTNQSATNGGISHSQKRRATSKVVVQYTPKEPLQTTIPLYEHQSPHFEQIQLPYKDPEPPPTPTPVIDMDDSSTDAIRCVCGFQHDDGLSIACDDCSRWCHAACFGISKDTVPENWSCWVCAPGPVSDAELRENAVKIQKKKLIEAQQLLAQKERESREKDRHHHGGKRRTGSPGVDRKRKASSSAANEGASISNKRKRRASMLATSSSSSHPTPNPNQYHAVPNGENDDIEVVVDDSGTPSSAHPNRHSSHDDQGQPPWQVGYTPITEDVVPHSSTVKKLRTHAQNWRGISALEPWVPPEPHPKSPNSHNGSQSSSTQPFASSSKITLQELPVNGQDSAECIRPPSFTLHTTQPTPSSSYLFPYPSLITPSSVYLSNPLNGYAHMGVPKPFVHLIGPPLDVALDTRTVGNEGRWIRNGCRPNAVIRPMVCPKKKPKSGKPTKKRKVSGKENQSSSAKRKVDGRSEERGSNGKGVRWAAEEESGASESGDETTLSFGVFATKDLNEGEEVVLGWEWDDGSAVHMLPAAVRTPGMFPPAHLAHLKDQMAGILHGITSAFMTCACGRNTKDCALTQMERFVYDEHHYGSLNPGPSRLRRRPRRSTSHDGHDGDESGLEDEEVEVEGSEGMDVDRDRDVDFGPLLGHQRGFRTRPKSKGSGGMGGVEMWPEEDPTPVSRQRGDINMSGDNLQDGEETEDEVWMKERPQTQQQPRPPDPALRKGADRGAKPRQVTFDRDNRPAHVLGEGAAPEEGDGVTAEVKEEQMPPKMRKRWMHKETETLKKDPGLFRQEDVLRPVVKSAKQTTPEEDVEMDDLTYPPDATPEHEHRERSEPMEEVVEKPSFHAVPTSTPPPSSAPERPSSLPTFPRSSLSFLAEAAVAAASPSEPFSRLSLSSPAVSTWRPATSSLHKILNATNRDRLEGTEYPFSFTHRSPPPKVESPAPQPPPEIVQPPQQTIQPPHPTPMDTAMEQDTPRVDSAMDVEERVQDLQTPVGSPPRASTEAVDSPQVLQPSWSPLRRNEELPPPKQESLEPQQREEKVEEVERPQSPPETPSPSQLPAPSLSDDGAMESPAPAHDQPPADVEPPVETQAPAPTIAQSPEASTSPIPESIDVRVRSPTPAPAREPTPLPPPPPKVKMSLKDFALRKKKKKEEEKATISATPSVAGGSVEASPAVAHVQLALETSGAAEHVMVVDSNDSVSPTSPVIQHALEAVTNTLQLHTSSEHLPSHDAETTMDTSPLSDQTVVETPSALLAEPAKHRAPSEDSPAPGIAVDQPSDDQRSLEAKKELLETAIPPAPPEQEQPSISGVKSNGVVPPSPPTATKSLNPGTTSPSLSIRSTSSRNLSQEEGEILSPPRETSPPAKPLSSRMPIRGSSYVPRSHTPPTQPRSFSTLATSPQSQGARPPPSSRPPPSGPRALRMSGGNYQSSPYSGDRSGPSFSQRPRMPPPPRSFQDRDDDKDRRHHSIPPRGPSADRDRDRERDLDRDRDRDRIWNSRRGSGWGR